MKGLALPVITLVILCQRNSNQGKLRERARYMKIGVGECPSYIGPISLNELDDFAARFGHLGVVRGGRIKGAGFAIQWQVRLDTS